MRFMVNAADLEPLGTRVRLLRLGLLYAAAIVPIEFACEFLTIRAFLR